ncbi:MAG: bifunctional phosphoserine phosphatase/homoserine phosphotransferase ThrH [Deltaproteobacteria bacterium]|nr:MAG: bifunctional phosphoserine phosphatase/homoserine phosphotransferase ThrH [Deltaproteobacteria bacterium]
MYIVCTDLEGVYTPEIWINVAQKTGIEKLRLTTRDIPDYDLLMQGRLAILKENGLTLGDIQDVIATLKPLEGAREFLNWLRSRLQVVVVSDTFIEFARPLMKQLDWPTLFCHDLTVDDTGTITAYNLRQPQAKKQALLALKSLDFTTIGIGDSYNDIDMIQAADYGILFRPPPNVIEEFPELPVTTTYDELKTHIERIIKNGNPERG